MSHSILLPKKTFFYPIGNTSATHLTQDLPPEEPAAILLLGCGDPRNVLYTIYSNNQIVHRELDFTCCDLEPAVLARNVLLFTLIVDNHDNTKVWNIFFHMRLDKASLTLLLDQCRNLVKESENLASWQNSQYGSFLQMCTSHTLQEIRRHWSLYVATADLSPEHTKSIRNTFESQSEGIAKKHKINLTACRSAGPCLIHAMQLVPTHFQQYWNTGVSSFDSKFIARSTYINPTFMYSSAGEGFFVHYGTDPIVPFHLAVPLASSRSESASTVSDSAKQQFSAWCKSLKESVSSQERNVVIRVFAGDALAFCHSLYRGVVDGNTDTGVYRAPWTSTTIDLDGGGYLNAQSPTKFNVIDTSNLTDHVGLLNILLATAPILTNNPSSALYTEALVASGNDPTKGFVDRVGVDIPIMSLLLGIAPTTYAYPFTTHSNTHEITMNRAGPTENTQFHERVTWKNLAMGDTDYVRNRSSPPAFDELQLAQFLWNVYLKVFSNEDVTTLRSKPISGWELKERSQVHYTRETYTLFLRMVKDRVDVNWDAVINKLFNFLNHDETLLTGKNNYQDLCCQLHIRGVYSAPSFNRKLEAKGRFKGWDSIPVLVCIVLVVPRKALKVVEDMDGERVGNPMLQCETEGPSFQNMFSSIHLAFGNLHGLEAVKGEPRLQFEEDPAGWAGSSDLIVSFWIPSWHVNEQADTMRISLAFRTTPATVSSLAPKLGYGLKLFTANLADTAHVHVHSEHPSTPTQLSSLREISYKPETAPRIEGPLGTPHSPLISLNEACKQIQTVSVRVDVEEAEAKKVFQNANGGTISTNQISPCVMRVVLDGWSQEVSFPYPVIGSRSKLRIARKSLYIEVVVPVSELLQPDGYAMRPFPVVIQDKNLSLWNVHYVNLSQLPGLDTKIPARLDWFNIHVTLAMSDRERALRERGAKDDVLVNLKDTLHTIFVRSTGIQGGPKARIFSLVEETGDSDTILFVTGFKLDLSSHTVIAEAFILPLTKDIIHDIIPTLERITPGGVRVKMYGDELKTWKRLFPALTERCREWKHTENCEYIAKSSVPVSDDFGENPLCGCGRGKDLESFSKVAEWRPLARYVTRAALSPLFTVSYLETVGLNLPGKSDVAQGKCAKCGGFGKPKILICGRCKKANYCSTTCQKEDWRLHKAECKNV